MAIDDAYATAAQYRSAVGMLDTSDDAEVLEQLTAVSRVLEQEVGRIFNQSAATRYFDGNGRARLYVDDLASVDADGLQVDENVDGTYETKFDPATETWSALGPYNASERVRPYRFVDLLPLSGNSTLTVWPRGVRNVAVVGTWGWPTAVPTAIREVVITLTRQLRELQRQGLTFATQGLETQLQMTPGAWPLIQNIKRQYGRNMPVVA